MTWWRDTLEKQIREAQKRHEQSKADLASLQSRAKMLARKLDTRRKIIVGAGVFAHIAVSARFREQVGSAMQLAITRPQDRALLPEFFPEARAVPAPPARPPKPEEPLSDAAPAPVVSRPEDGAVLPEFFPEARAAPTPPARPPRKEEPPSGAAPA